jgi:hypothetical protein
MAEENKEEDFLEDGEDVLSEEEEEKLKEKLRYQGYL